tara:strand:- start:252 stop:602 length:351 start_codon:yes stop_codon:yes gene_type:complete
MSLPTLGKYLYTVPFVMFGLMHFTNTDALAGMVPIPGGALWIYLTGLCLLAASVSVYTGKHTALAMKLLGLLLLIIVGSIHVPGVLGGNQASMTPMLLTTGLAGGAFVLAGVHEES